MKYSNLEMEKMLASLKPILLQRNKIGYIAARNTRTLQENLTEYFKFKNNLIEKYGEHERDEKGNMLPNICVKPDMPNFEKFKSEYKEIAAIEHNVELMKLKYEEVIDILSGEEILELTWLFEE